MGELPAWRYDGQSSRRERVMLRLDPGGALVRVIHADGRETLHPAQGVTVSPRVGHTPRRLALADGSLCEVSDNDAIDAWLRGGGRQERVSRWEGRWRVAFAMLALTAVLGVLGSVWGLPWLAETVTAAVPRQAEVALGDSALSALDSQGLFRPSRLDAAQRQRLTALFQRVTAGAGEYPYRLEFRDSPALKANALAFPGGVVVVTDDLAALVREDAEFLGVAAHEAAHIRHRHALRLILHDSLLTVLTAALLGDAATLSYLSVTLPTVLVNLAYSREFELAADRDAVDFLKKAHLPPESYGNLLRRLHEQTPGSALGDLWSDHPALDARIEGIR